MREWQHLFGPDSGTEDVRIIPLFSTSTPFRYHLAACPNALQQLGFFDALFQKWPQCPALKDAAMLHALTHTSQLPRGDSKLSSGETPSPSPPPPDTSAQVALSAAVHAIPEMQLIAQPPPSLAGRIRGGMLTAIAAGKSHIAPPRRPSLAHAEGRRRRFRPKAKLGGGVGIEAGAYSDREEMVATAL